MVDILQADMSGVVAVQSLGADHVVRNGAVNLGNQTGFVFFEKLDASITATAEAGVLHQVKVFALGFTFGCLYLGATDTIADVWLADDGECGADCRQSDQEDQKRTHG